MRAVVILCVLLLGALILIGLNKADMLRLLRPRRALPLYVRVEADAQNIEWLITRLLRQAPHRQLLVLDHTGGENKKILSALMRRYHLDSVSEAPPDAPVLQIKNGVTIDGLLAQYRRIKGGEKAQQTAG